MMKTKQPQAQPALNLDCFSLFSWDSIKTHIESHRINYCSCACGSFANNLPEYKPIHMAAELSNSRNAASLPELEHSQLPSQGPQDLEVTLGLLRASRLPHLYLERQRASKDTLTTLSGRVAGWSECLQVHFPLRIQAGQPPGP